MEAKNLSAVSMDLTAVSALVAGLSNEVVQEQHLTMSALSDALYGISSYIDYITETVDKIDRDASHRRNAAN